MTTDLLEALGENDVLRAVIERLRATVKDRNAEIERLRGELDGINDAYRATMEEVCNDPENEVEKHCTCVPFLREEVKRLVAANKRLLVIAFEPGPDREKLLKENDRMHKGWADM